MGRHVPLISFWWNMNMSNYDEHPGLAGGTTRPISKNSLYIHLHMQCVREWGWWVSRQTDGRPVWVYGCVGGSSATIHQHSSQECLMWEHVVFYLLKSHSYYYCKCRGIRNISRRFAFEWGGWRLREWNNYLSHLNITNSYFCSIKLLKYEITKLQN